MPPPEHGPCNGYRQGEPFILGRDCRICWLAANDSTYQEAWGGPTSTQRTIPCKHLGRELGLQDCPSCQGSVRVKILQCALYQRCTIARQLSDIACCATCRSYEPVTLIQNSQPVRRIKWAYGVTTIPERRDTLLRQTLASLSNAGFDKPRLFIDGRQQGYEEAHWQGLEVTTRWPTIRTFGNWVLGLAELYIREPTADRYAMFQDDFVTYKNLRTYLDKCEYPSTGYWNLYTFPQNEELAYSRLDKDKPNELADATGWYESNQRGLGAVALVFSRQAVITLLTHQHMVERPQDAQRGWKAIDGGIVTAFAKAGWKEYVHYPSLVQHTGISSTMGNRPHKQSASFRGEGFDAMGLLKVVNK